jgi:8-oxo-dGTP pyrophosphatase MutT (NUDIX family)
MIHYVAGLLFNEARTAVALILKDRAGWNAIGGEMTPGEHPPAAMRREFLEKTGLSVLASDWRLFLSLRSANQTRRSSLPEPESWRVDFFHASVHDEVLKRARTMETEEVAAWSLAYVLPHVDSAPGYPIIPSAANLRWIIPMALSAASGNAERYEVREVAHGEERPT